METLKNNLYKHVEFLSTLDPPRNCNNEISINKTIDYISEQFRNNGYEVEYQEYEIPSTLYTHRNVITHYGSKNNQRLIVGAHYDVCMDTPGADDNASAVAGMIETARLLIDENPQLDYCVEFVAYANEEPPFFGSDKMGSYIHAHSLNENHIDVLGMICYEMIGYFSDEPGSQEIPQEINMLKKYGTKLKMLSNLPDSLLNTALGKFNLEPTYVSYILENKAFLPDIINSLDVPDKGNFIIVLGQPEQKDFASKVFKNIKNGCDIDAHHITLPKGPGLAELSDHMNYWKYGYNAVMINDTSFLRNPNYHLISDTIDTLNFDKMTEVVRGVYNSVKSF